MKTIRLLAASLALISTTTLAASLQNGDFSTGDLTGWTYSPQVAVVSNGAGGYAADLFAGLGQNIYTTLSQNIYLNAGDTLQGWAQWLGHDYMPFNDDGFVSVGNQTLFSADIAQYGNYGSSPVTNFSFTASQSDWYELLIGVRDIGDGLLSSELQAGGFSVTANPNDVPEPASIALLAIGLTGLGLRRGMRR